MMAERSPRQLYHRRTSKYETIHQIITAGRLSLQPITWVLFGYLERPQQGYASSWTVMVIYKRKNSAVLRETFKSEKDITFIDLGKVSA